MSRKPSSDWCDVQRLQVDKYVAKRPLVPICAVGTKGDHWQIIYRDEWRELPWHPEGPQRVTRELVRKWHGDARTAGSGDVGRFTARIMQGYNLAVLVPH